MGDIWIIVALFFIGLVTLGAYAFCAVMRRRERSEIAKTMEQVEHPGTEMIRWLAVRAIESLKENDPEGKTVIDVYRLDSNPEMFVLFIRSEHDAPTEDSELKGKFVLAATARDCKEKAERLRKAAS